MITINPNDQSLNFSVILNGEKWNAIKLIPTDRYYISFDHENGADYEMVDAVVMLAKVDGDETLIKAVGLNFGMTNYYDVYLLEETFDQLLLDILDMEQLEKLISSKIVGEGLSRGQALREIKRDFLHSRIRLTAEVMEAFDHVK